MTSAPTSSHHLLQRALDVVTASDRLVRDAEFVCDALPNVDAAAIRRALMQLSYVDQAIRALSLEDNTLEASQLHPLLTYVANLRSRVVNNIQPSQANTEYRAATIRTGGVGRPRYEIDLDDVENLRWHGATWDEIAAMLGCSSRTVRNRMKQDSRSTARPYSVIEDEELDQRMNDLKDRHPFSGAVIMSGLLFNSGIRLPLLRVKESLRRVDPVGVMIRWSATAKRRVYRVRGSNALWHQDGNEKLRPWGFYVHGCVDGHSRLIIYLSCSTNKRADTVTALFDEAIRKYGVPSRVRGDHGTENNGIAGMMEALRGAACVPYLRGKSTHNVRMERAWRDVRKDCLELFRRIFMALESNDLLNMDVRIHRVALALVFQHRIQSRLDDARDAWNAHPLSTEGNKSPFMLYEMSKRKAQQEGTWDEPGDSLEEALAEFYGVEDDDDENELLSFEQDFPDKEDDEEVLQEEEINNGTRVNSDLELIDARKALEAQGFDLTQEDDNNGINVYLECVLRLSTVYPEELALVGGFA